MTARRVNELLDELATLSPYSTETGAVRFLRLYLIRSVVIVLRAGTGARPPRTSRTRQEIILDLFRVCV